MAFEIANSIPIDKNNEVPKPFNVSNSRAVAELRAARPGELGYTPYLTDEQKSQAVVELTAKEKGQEVPIGTKAMWFMDSPEGKAVTESILMPTVAAWKAMRGIAQGDVYAKNPFQMIWDNARKGVLEPDKVEPLGASMQKAYPSLPWQVSGVLGTIAEAGALFEVGKLENFVAGGGLGKDSQFSKLLNDVRKSDKWNTAVTWLASQKNLTPEVADSLMTRAAWENRDKVSYINTILLRSKYGLGPNLMGETGQAGIKSFKPGQVVRYGKDTAKILGLEGEKVSIDIAGTVTKVGLNEISPMITEAGTKSLNITEEAQAKIAQIADDIKPKLEEVKGKPLTHAEVLEAAKGADILNRTISREQTLKLEAELLRSRENLSAMANQPGVTKELIDTLQNVSAYATNLGRQLESLKIPAESEYITIKIKLIKDILKTGAKAEEIIKAAENVDFTSQEQVTKFYREFVKPRKLEILNELRYINILSSPKTHIVNAFSNMLQVAGLTPATKLISGVIDPIASSLFKVDRTKYIKEVPAYYRGVFASLPEAMGKFKEVMKGNIYIQRPDVKSIRTGSSLTEWGQAIPRLLEASDVFFRTLAEKGEIEALAEKGITGAKAVLEAKSRSSYSVFRAELDPANKEGQGYVLSMIDNLTTGLYALRKNGLVAWFVPFVATPMNILKQGIEYSPIGFATIPKAKDKVEQTSKALIGSMIALGGGLLALQGRTTWAVPRSKKEKELFYASGKQPYSIKIGNNWVNYSRIGPMAYAIALPAAIKWYFDEQPKVLTDNNFQKTAKLATAMAKFFSDQSYMQGLGDFISVVQGDELAVSKSISSAGSQVIPITSFLRWVNGIIDPLYRKTDKDLSIESIFENMISGIPGASMILEPRKDIYGKPSKKQNVIMNALSPLTITKESRGGEAYYKQFKRGQQVNALKNKSTGRN